MSTVTVSVNIAGTADVEDKQAFLLAIGRENERRVFTGEAPLPTSTAAERRASIEMIMSKTSRDELARLVQEAADKANQDALFRQVKTKWNELTEQQRTAWLNYTP